MPKRATMCGGQKRGGGKCLKPAGWGTSHPGIGKCKMHGGSTQTHVRAAANEEFRKLLGNPIDTTPGEAIMTCIRIRAGEVQWLSDRLAELDKKHWIEDTMVGKQFHLYARERQHAMADLVRFSQIAIALNLSERAIRLAETYGELIANYTKRLIDQLMPYLDEEGQKNWPIIVRETLLAVDSEWSRREVTTGEMMKS